MLKIDNRLRTLQYLEAVRRFFPNDPRPDLYYLIASLVSNFAPVMVAHPTLTKKLYDETTAEMTFQRFFNQLERAVVGKRDDSHLPRLVILERHADLSLHAHIIIGKATGGTKPRFKEEFTDKLMYAFCDVKARLTFPCGDIRPGPIGRIGRTVMEPVYNVEGAVDYALKKVKSNNLYIAELATNLNFLSPTSSKCSLDTKHLDGVRPSACPSILEPRAGSRSHLA
jgi:hypothetical protein